MLLLVGDLHLTDRGKDNYRFGIFPWIRKQQAKYQPAATILMGDLTDQKDKHPASLVNRIVDELTKLEPPVFIIMGNHDYIAEQNPFFKFLSRLEGIKFVIEPAVVLPGVAIVPHCRSEATFVKACADVGRQIDYLFLHQTIEGAIAESGARLSGFSAAPIEALGPGVRVYAGDVHRPQRAGIVTYVGSPYSIRFGDEFEPRCLLLKDPFNTVNLYYDCPRKWKLIIRSAEEITNNKQLLEKDQVKVTVELAREEAVEGKTYIQQVKEACAKKGIEVFGVEIKINSATLKKQAATGRMSRLPAEVVKDFCKAEKLSNQIKQAGLEFIND